MKKVWIIAIVVVLLLLCATGAFFLFYKDFYAQTRDRLAASCETLTLKITVGKGEEELLGTYHTSFSEERTDVNYVFEELALFELQNGVYVAPTSRIKQERGSISLQNGEVLSQQGKLPPVSISIVTLSGFSFQEEYFADAKITDTSFEAGVKDPYGLLGLDKESKNVHLTMSFDEERVLELNLTYETKGAEPVTMSFSFAD